MEYPIVLSEECWDDDNFETYTPDPKRTDIIHVLPFKTKLTKKQRREFRKQMVKQYSEAQKKDT